MANSDKPTITFGLAPIQPPIPDVNHNGVLDEVDIKAALLREETPNFVRTPYQPAHSVMEALGTRQVALDLLGQKDKKDAVTMLRNFSSDAATSVRELVDALTEKTATDPRFREEKAEEVRADAQTMKFPPEVTAVNLADMKNLIDFAVTFNATFPGGVRIAPAGMAGIVSHFAHSPFQRGPEEPAKSGPRR